jgi:hypothetical protein
MPVKLETTCTHCSWKWNSIFAEEEEEEEEEEEGYKKPSEYFEEPI